MATALPLSFAALLERRRAATTSRQPQSVIPVDALASEFEARLRLGQDGPEVPEFGAFLPFHNPLAALLARRTAAQRTAAAVRVPGSGVDDSLPPPTITTAADATNHHDGSIRNQTLEPFDEQELGRDWLLQRCAAHLQSHSDENTHMSPEQLCTDIFSILRTDKDDNDIQTSLVDLIGYSDLDFISALLSNRAAVVENVISEAAYRIEQQPIRQQSSETDLGRQAASIPDLSKPVRPAYGAQVTVMSEKERQQIKTQRKERRKQAKISRSELETTASASLLGFDGERLRNARAEQLIAASNVPAVPVRGSLRLDSGSSQPTYPNVFKSATGGSSLSVFGTKFVLPAGTERLDEKDYEEVTIPVSKPIPIRATEKQISINDMSDIAKIVFKKYTSLNRVQSIVYPVAFETNENMLVCAPTGAGKTDVAMLTVLRTITQHSDQGRIDVDKFKIVYVAPMKALAAEIVRKFSSRLGPLNIKVRELTGDMQLTKAELSSTQMIVTTPEKWDVVTRKSHGDTELVQKVRLLIIDEVHLLHEDRGAVIESLVARTLRLVESSQSLIRIVGLSATLPNYVDVASFLGVNPYLGLFFFDAGFRPVPLEQHLVGVKGKTGSTVFQSKTNQICYDKVASLVRDGHQVMVFVHARKETVRTSQNLREQALEHDELGIFDCTASDAHGNFTRDVARSKNKELRELFMCGFGIHHAGMLRADRTLTEQMFEAGALKVLCCTATLAWGVNLPAYAVVIKGTQIYDAQKGSFVDLSILDVFQIFGRAGRPQFEDRGVGYILTSHDKLNHYVSSMTQQHPIESQFSLSLADNLNAEISLGTVTNLDEAVKWLSYTYLYVRMRRNPFQYGIDWSELQEDPLLGRRRRDLVVSAAQILHKAQMIVFDERTGFLLPKDLGRIASNFYINHASVEVFNAMMRPNMTEADALSMLSMSTEFENIKVRNEEIVELKKLHNECVCAVKGGVDTNYGKTNILLQSYISRSYIEDFALVSDAAYVAQNASRILRALFEIAMSRNWGPTASVILSLCKTIDRRMWSYEHPLNQYDLPYEILTKIDRAGTKTTIESMRDMDAGEIGDLVRHHRMGERVLQCVRQFPLLHLEARIAPITRTILRVDLEITPDFVWNDRMHGGSEPWWIWCEDPESAEILHSEYFVVSKRQATQTQKLGFTIPIPQSKSTVDGLPPQIFIRAISDRWIGSENVHPVSFKHLILPEHNRAPHTDLLDLLPLPISALKNEILEEICGRRFEFFNPVQTQIFHTLYHTQHNALIGAPTGSGKTVAAELALWAAFRDAPRSKVVYIAPLKALVRERVKDWRLRLTHAMCRNLVELTGDVTPDLKTLQTADIIITTPEKWDGISRGWQTRKYVTDVSLVIIDEIHLLGSDRGPILEVIVSRMKYISAKTKKAIRIVGLSTALANAGDLADWLGIGHVGLFNFRHSVRPVPLEIYIEGYPGKHYCPRMISMNKPTYAAIMTHSPTQPVIVFVSSRRQTRLTAQDLISFCANDDNPRRFVHMPEAELEVLAAGVKDQALKLSLQFGIGLHHAGLIESDRKLSEELFVNGKIQILVATSTLAWGVNFPAHLVVIKGTEFYDAKTHTYVDFPITDVLQMMGRAGRPQFDSSGVAVILVHDVKKNFYKKFLHEPFPVESSLHTCLDDHLCAEVVGGTIKTKQDAMDYLSWTYLFRRVRMNPTFYGAEDSSDLAVNTYLSGLIEDAFERLKAADCIEVIDRELDRRIDMGDAALEREDRVSPTDFGKIASFYYLQYQTMSTLRSGLARNLVPPSVQNYGDMAKLLLTLSSVAEYDELPVRHNEEWMNQDLERSISFPIKTIGTTRIFGYDDPHLKTFYLIQAHLANVAKLPCPDYHTDTITVLDQSVRIAQAMIDVCVLQGYFGATMACTKMLQCIKQARWTSDPPTVTLPNMTTPFQVTQLKSSDGTPITGLMSFSLMRDDEISRVVAAGTSMGLSDSQCRDVASVVSNLPHMNITYTIPDAKNKDDRWIVSAESACTLRLCLTRRRAYTVSKLQSQPLRIYAPRFPKPQMEAWWVVLGDARLDDVFAFKRVVAAPSTTSAAGNTTPAGRQNMSNSDVSTRKFCVHAGSQTHVSLTFESPRFVGDCDLQLYVVSDGYLGMDHAVTVRLRVV